jgi:ABC-2 type transport system ATP-binding protein
VSAAISARGLHKSYGGTPALVDVSIELAPGERLAIVGPAGAGKTTLLRILAGLLPATGGHVQIGEAEGSTNASTDSGRVALVDREELPHGGLRAREYLSFVTSVGLATGTPEAPIMNALKRAKIDGRVEVENLSAGTRARLALVAAIISRADVLLLDDPLALLDPLAHVMFDAWLHERAELGATIVVALEDETQGRAWCPRLAHLEAGRLR